MSGSCVCSLMRVHTRLNDKSQCMMNFVCNFNSVFRAALIAICGRPLKRNTYRARRVNGPGNAHVVCKFGHPLLIIRSRR